MEEEELRTLISAPQRNLQFLMKGCRFLLIPQVKHELHQKDEPRLAEMSPSVFDTLKPRIKLLTDFSVHSQSR